MSDIKDPIEQKIRLGLTPDATLDEIKISLSWLLAMQHMLTARFLDSIGKFLPNLDTIEERVIGILNSTQNKEEMSDALGVLSVIVHIKTSLALLYEQGETISGWLRPTKESSQ